MDRLFICKDFDTALTKVKLPVQFLPGMDKTTNLRDEDLIRDRLLSFKVRNGSLATYEHRDKREYTINERTAARA